MAERKIKVIRLKVDEARQKLMEAEKLAELAAQEEAEKLNAMRQTIDALTGEENVFCGVILTAADITAIVDLALKTNEPVTIPYNLYFKD